tara:strand:- start:20 stop:787 length:768 start_codon:yes stop_codon:yes gene_type:complete
MSKYEYKYVEGIPVARYVNDAEGITDDIPIGTIRNDRLEDCPAEGRFIEKRFVQNSQCPICEKSLAEDYTGPKEEDREPRGIPGGNVRRRSSAIYQLGCGHRFHAGCLLDYLTSTQTFVTIDANGNQTESSVPFDNIMTHAMEGREGGITCPEPTCFKKCFTPHVDMLIDYFIGEESERVPPGPEDNVRQYDTAEYTGSDPPDPPSEDACYPNGCTLTGGKRKTKNKIKKKKRTKKKTKKIKKKLNKTKRKNSKK